MARTRDSREASVQRLMRLVDGLDLPEVELSTSYGDPSLKLRGKAICTVKADDLLYLPCPIEAKEMLMEAAPHIYFQTEHYQGWPGLLVRLDVIGDEELGIRLEDAWRYRAPKRLASTRPLRHETRP
jgi:hypothetical protein